MSDTMITVTGIIELNLFTPEKAQALKNQTLQAACFFNVTEDCIYLGDIDNKHEFIEHYALYVATLLEPGHEPQVWKCEGTVVEQRRDIIIEDNRVWIQHYALEKSGEREEYKGVEEVC